MPSPASFVTLADNFFNQSFSGFVNNFTFTFSSSATYDPITGTYSNTGVDYSIPCIRMNFKRRQFDGNNIKIGDIKLISRVASWDALGVEPKVEDTRVTVNSVVYQLIDVMKDAADAVYTIQVRKL